MSELTTIREISASNERAVLNRFEQYGAEGFRESYRILLAAGTDIDEPTPDHLSALDIEDVEVTYREETGERVVLDWDDEDTAAALAAAYTRGWQTEYLASADIRLSASIMAKLDLNAAQLNSMFAVFVVDGHRGIDVIANLRRRFEIIDVCEPLGAALAERGILTDEEGAWLDDGY